MSAATANNIHPDCGAICPDCGANNQCCNLQPDSKTPCWCLQFPAITPVTDEPTRCRCQACLGTLVEQQHERKS